MLGLVFYVDFRVSVILFDDPLLVSQFVLSFSFSTGTDLYMEIGIFDPLYFRDENIYGIFFQGYRALKIKKNCSQRVLQYREGHPDLG